MTTATLTDKLSSSITPTGVRMVYLLSRYPAVSHTFFLNEILQLRRLGFSIEVASINAPDRAQEAMSPDERNESHATYYIKSMPLGSIFGIFGKTLFLRPGVFFRGLRAALNLGGWNLPATLFALFYFVEAILLGDWMVRRGHTHLHIHFSGPVATVGMLTSIAWELPYSLTVHGPDEFYDVNEFYLTRKIEHAKFVLCISNFCRSQLMRNSSPEHWHKFHVVRLGIDPDVFHPRRPAHSEDGVIQMICVGRLVPAKGQLILIRAVADLLSEGYAVHLRLVGDGPDRRSLESFVADHRLNTSVTFEGSLSHESTRRLLETADLFVLASFAEGVPVALMEAMAMEIPCVSTLIAGIPELIRNGMDGVLVPASSPEELTSALKLLIDDPEKRAALAASGRERVLELYNLPRNIRVLASIFEQQLAGTA